MATVAKPKVRKFQQQHKCYPLEPVQEDCVTKLDDVARKPSKQQSFRAKGGLLSKLRDRYVTLMNDMASSADFAGVSVAYGGSTRTLDFPGAAAMAQQEEEMEQAAFMAGVSPTQKKA